MRLVRCSTSWPSRLSLLNRTMVTPSRSRTVRSSAFVGMGLHVTSARQRGQRWKGRRHGGTLHAFAMHRMAAVLFGQQHQLVTVGPLDRIEQVRPATFAD